MVQIDGLQVAEAAEHLGLSEQRIRALLAKGALDGEKIAGRWFVNPQGVRRWQHRKGVRGRPLSPDNAWGVLFAASGDEPDWLSPWDRSRLQDRLEASWEKWLPRLENRARMESFYAHPSEIKRLKEDPSLVLSGVSAEVPGNRLVGRNELEAYVHEGKLRNLIARYKLSGSSRSNVHLHVVSGRWPFEKGVRSAPSAVIALDLIESGDPRSVREGKSLIRHLRKRSR